MNMVIDMIKELKELKELENQELIELYALILKELRDRNVVRTHNSPVGNYDKNEFDYLIVIFFDKDFTVKEAYKMPHEDIKKYGSYSKHQNGYILTVNQKVINE